MSVQLLDRIKKINKLLHNNKQSKLVFSDICEIMGGCLSSNMLVLSSKGKVLGSFKCDDVDELTTLLTSEVGTRIAPELNERLLNILSVENIVPATLGFDPEESNGFCAMVNPIEISGERFGTIILYRKFIPYDVDDIILCEYATTVVGLEILRSESEDLIEDQRKQSNVKNAVASLSLSEYQAAKCIVAELEGDEAILITSKIAEATGITRSVIINAIRKLESADVIVSRSSGMKGTYIKITNEYLREELDKQIR